MPSQLPTGTNPKKKKVDVDPDKHDLETVRKALRKAVKLKDPRDMWHVVKDCLDLLTLILVPE